MLEFKSNSQSFQMAELRSECTRVKTLLSVLGVLLILVLLHGITSRAAGHRGEAWPFAVLLAMMVLYEVAWLRVVQQAVEFQRGLVRRIWIINLFIESLLPSIALYLEIHTSFEGPERALTSGVVLAYFLLIILSTLHLDSALSRLAGMLSAASYTAISIYVFARYPQAAAGHELLAYSTAISYTVLLGVGGVAAGAVASQIRMHVVAALREAESRAKITQMEHDLGIARSIQQGLLPADPPQIQGFDIAGWNQPADETGGDFYDWQPLPQGRIAIMIADVTGHGIGPALCMAACRAYARAGLAADANLCSFARRLNQLLYQDLPPEKFVTLAAGVLDPERATLDLISAGHGPLLFYSSSDDCFRSGEAQGLPLGLMPQCQYDCSEVLEFSRGDILVWITDGFIEWANSNDEDFGQIRLEEVIRANRERPAAKIISEMYSAVRKFSSPMPQADDLTAVVMKRV